jgi:hypothetical protein
MVNKEMTKVAMALAC